MSTTPSGPSGAGTSAAPSLTGMLWGIKASFLSYLAGVADAETSVTDGAALTPTGEYLFPLADASAFDTSTRTGLLVFRGDVRFAGYGRMMFVVIKDPVLHFEAGQITLTIADVYTEGDPAARRPLVTLEASDPVEHDGMLTWTSMPSRLALNGIDMFNDVYEEGEPFDPVHVRVPLF